PRSPVPAAVELPDLIAEVRDEFMTRSSLPASSFVVSHSDRLPPAQVDRAQIKTLLAELVNNAADAIEQPGGNIAINCRAQVSDGVVEVTVRDNGTGMTPAVLERVFDPFFSHHKAGRRRGFGLARAHRIVEAHGGRIWLESRPNEGTVAHVVLPAAPAGVTRTSVTSTTSETTGAAGV
ncbi:MAG: ATP-binding protein, partial [Planctomycetes bacterium]|nr:ATP-binding protein [Planctomycetota bacterium]